MLGLIALFLVAQVEGGESRGAVYELDGRARGAKLFDIVRRTSRADDELTVTMEFRSAQGELAVVEQARFDDKIRPRSYWRRDYQTGGRGQITFEGPTIEYEWRDGDGRDHRARESSDEPVVVGPMMFAYFAYHWPAIRRGETISFRILVPDRQTSYQFEFERVEEVTIEGRTYAKCKLSLSGFIGLFVGDMVFYLDPDTGQIVRYTGMVLPKRQTEDGWESVKGYIQYEHPAATQREKGPAGP